MLREIFHYYKVNASLKVARSIKSEILSNTKKLRKNPLIGQEEPFLEHLGLGHRYLVVGNYKVIYRCIEDQILITDVFDARQNPKKMNQER
jgi:plasmid stabilization system protein ParE